MERYDLYKDSGVEWIGEIPSSWGKTKLKYKLQEVVTGGTPDTSNDSFWSDEDKGINWISISDITSNGREISGTKKFISEKGLKSKKLKILPIGSLIYSIYGSIGKISRLGIPSTVHQGILGLRTNSTYNTTFLEYYLIYFKEYVSLFSSSNTQENLNQEKVSNFDIPVPPLSEQQQIVSFLDTKTSLIDSLIEKTQRKIELLKEKRTSLINEVVTKGLNPNVEMKDSDVEWIGEIPSHWDTPFFGLISNLQQGLQIPFDNRFFEKEEGMFEYITTKSVHNPNDPRQYVLNPKKSVVCGKDEILYGRTGNTGEVITNVEGVFHNNFFKIVYDKDKLVKEYLIYQLTNSRFRETILLLSGTTTIPDLNHGDFNSMRCLIPPVKEQQQIVEFLDEQTGLIDKTISIEEKRIELLKEYRQSLISEVVTGKRKVVE